MSQLKTRIAAVAGVALVMSLMMAETADARRRGSFGSRGARTYTAPPPTQTAPNQIAPVQRSMTPPPAQGAQAARPATAPAANPALGQQRRGGIFGGFGGGLLGGLLAGGLIGALLGNGFGAGMAGFGAMLFQLAILALGVFLLMKLFRRRQQQPAAAMAGYGAMREQAPPPPQPQPYSTYTPTTTAYGSGSPIEITVDAGDRREFERLLTEVQAAYTREDYAALRELTTPEIMSYLAEELSQNAVQGRRNDVSAVKLLEADVAEAWREGDAEYATAALRYESIDIFRDRDTGQVVQGDPNTPTQETELWTFVRRPGSGWKLSAIQET